MRVAYVGNFEPEWSTENDVRKAFEHLGHEVIRLQENGVNWETLRSIGLSSDLLLWTSTWDDAQPLDRSVETLWLLAERGVPTAALHLDTFWSTSRGGRNWRANPMWQCRTAFTADGDFQDAWDDVGVEHVWLPPAVRWDACHRGTPRDEYRCDVALVGSNGQGYHDEEWPYRKELHTRLREMCARRGWSFRNPGGDDPKVPRDNSMNDFYASASVTVGDSLCLRRSFSRYWSDRVPEALGRHGYLIMPEILALDETGMHVPQYPWSDWAELEAMIERALKDEQHRAAVISENAAEVFQRHTYVNRALTIIRETAR